MKHEEIAERLGMTKSAAQQTWERAKKKARDEGQPIPLSQRAS
jgi:predicted DNA binding protein